MKASNPRLDTLLGARGICRSPRTPSGSERSAVGPFRRVGASVPCRPSDRSDIGYRQLKLSAFPPVPREALPGVVQAACADVVVGVRLADASLDIEERLVHEATLALVVVKRRVGEQAVDDDAPRVDVLEHRLQVLAAAVPRAEVGQEERLRVPGEDRLAALRARPRGRCRAAAWAA